MMRRVSLILLLSVISLPALGAGGEVKVTVRGEAQVQPSHVVTVRDVASVQGPQYLVLKAERVSVATAPPPGERRALSSDYVRLRLDAAGLRGRVRMTGAKSVDIIGKCRRWSSESIAQAATRFVESALPTSPPATLLRGEGRTYEVSVERLPKALITPPDESGELRIRFLGAGVRNGLNTVTAEAVVGGRVAAASSVTVRVTEVAEVLTAVESIRQGEALTDRNTAWAKRDVSRISAPIRASDGPQSLIARRSITAGTVITSVDVISPPVVKKGDSVSVVVRCGAVKLVTTGEARQDGRRGEIIAVRPSSSTQDVRGRLTEPGLVEIVR